jgi:hypothetical protein
MKKNRLFEDDWKQCNEEAKMAKMQLKNIQANVAELLDKIESCEELDAWVQSYLTKADDYLDSVKKYVVFGQDEDTTVVEPTEVTPGEPETTGPVPPAATPALSNEPLMPPISGYDPDAEEAPATDLTPGAEGEEPEIEEPMEELPGGEEEFPEDGEEEVEDEDFPEDVEDVEDEDMEDVEDMEDEEEFPEEEEEVIEEPEELDDDEFKMPSMADFEIGGGEAVTDIKMPKPTEEDQLTFDDVEFFNGEEGPEEIEA